MPSSLWEQCNLDADIIAQVDRINEFYSNQTSKSHDNTYENSDIDEERSPRNAGKVNNLQSSLQDSESVCRESLETLDNILLVLNGVGDAYAEVTGRTNNLMMNCERLLEQQHTLQQTVEVLKTTIKPFTDIEEVATLLGIPFDGRTTNNKQPSNALAIYSTSNNNDQHSSNLDPRSPEFQDILSRLSKSALFLQTHYDILDKQHYTVWLERLQHRATSLVGRAMRDLISSAKHACDELNKAKLYGNKMQQSGNVKLLLSGSGSEDQPIESAPLYQKFRGLSFRMRELGALLARGGFFANIDGSNYDSSHLKKERHSRHYKLSASGQSESRRSAAGHNDAVRPVVTEVKQGYVMVRNDLLLSFLKDAWTAGGLNGARSPTPSNSGSNLASFSNSDDLGKNGTLVVPATPGMVGTSLCIGIRQSFATLLRVTQLEQQLFDSLFNLDNHSQDRALTNGVDSVPSTPVTPSTPSHDALSAEHNEVLNIVEAVSNATRDVLRPLIIRESSVDELCRVVSTLSEDVRSQMLAMPVPKPLLKQLLKGLDGTVNDAKERLSYCAETRIRQDVQMFEPLHAHLSYPEILETYAAAVASASTPTSSALTKQHSLSNIATAVDEAAVVTDVYQTWYPPMRHTLSLLSKLYGVVEMRVFEDFARRSVDLCVATLKTGSERVKRSRAAIHGDLFLVRHLLILREQLVPFEIRLQGTEKHLDFSSTGAAFTQLAANGRSVWRWDQSNGLLQFARSGLPGMQETQTDAKKDLDLMLKHACFSLKQTALKMLLGQLDGFLAKVTAFVGEIPTVPHANTHGNDLVSGGAHVPLLSTEARNSLKNQAFMRPERLKEDLESVQNLLVQSCPDLRNTMKLYIDNQIARTILIKPILQEFDSSKRRLECVIASCMDPGQPRRDLESLLQTIAYTVGAELSQ